MDLTDPFWDRVDRRGPDECWPWLGSRNRQGYGQIWDPARKIMTLSHRTAYRRFVQDIGPGQVGARGIVVRHACDNPPCCNPAHLLVGTQEDNMQDARDRRRWDGVSAGQRNGRAKLTAEQVAAIRGAITGRYGERSQLAREFGVSTAQISKILLGQTWT